LLEGSRTISFATVASISTVAFHAALRNIFRWLPGRTTARLLVAATHRSPLSAQAATRHFMSTPGYKARRAAHGLARTTAPQGPSFVFHNLRMRAPPSSFVQIYREATPTRAASGSVETLEAVLRAALDSGEHCKPLGRGYGFSTIAFTDGYLICLAGLDGILPVDLSTVKPNGDEELLQFEAGATIDKLNAAIPDGYALINQPGFGSLTFAGASSAGAHGSSLRWGALADAIRSMRILCVDAQRKPKWFQIEPTSGITIASEFKRKQPNVELIQEDATFDACIVAMGCVGLIYSMTIALRPTKTITENRTFMTWRDAKRGFDALVDENKDPKSNLHSFVYWLNPYETYGEQHVVVGTYREQGAPLGGARPLEITSIGGNQALEEVVVALVNWLPDLAPWLIDAAIMGAVDSDVVMNPAQALNFGAPNNLNVVATACAVPLDKTIDTADRLSRLLRGRKPKLTSTFGLRFVPRARGLFAPQGRGDTCMIEVPCLAGTDGLDETLEACWKDMVDQGARPHWGQRNPMDGPQLRAAYGEASVRAFVEVRKRLDPTGFFDNDFTRRVGL
jgi:L-gulono-1,4-lactone dehydrogenase